MCHAIRVKKWSKHMDDSISETTYQYDVRAGLVLRKVGDRLFKVGDYIYLYDTAVGQVLANKWSEEKLSDTRSCTDGPYYPLGGGREPSEGSIDCAIREAAEETGRRVSLNPKDLVFWDRFLIPSQEPFRFSDSTPLMHGKECTVYVARASKETIGRIKTVEEDGAVWEFDWYDAGVVFAHNSYLNLSAWRAFVARVGWAQ